MDYEMFDEIETIYTPYYKLNDGRVYDKDRFIFVTEADTEYKAFIDKGGKPLTVGDGYTVEQLKKDVIEFYGWHVGECLMSLDELRRHKLAELETEASKFENNLNKDMYFTSSLGFKCNGDRRTRSNIEDLITLLSSPKASVTTVEYRDYDNISRTLTKEQLQVLLEEHQGNGLNIYHQKWALQNKITKAKSVDELKGINITFIMKDFSAA